ncbi:MAG: O-antigen ligase family protein [Flavobacteriales bacterium]
MEKNKKEMIIFESLFFLLVLSLPLGYYFIPFATGPVHLFGYRIILILCFFLLLIKGKIVWQVGSFTRTLMLLIIAWVGYAALGYFWVSDKTAWLMELIFVAKGGIFIIVFLSFFEFLPRPKELFFKAWLTGLMSVLFICFLEMTYAVHFSGNFVDVLSDYPGGDLVRFIPAGTFDNPNNLSIYLIFSVVMLILLLKFKPARKEIWLIGILLCTLVIYQTHSRFANLILVVLCLSVMWLFLSPDYYRMLFSDKRNFLYPLGGLAIALVLIAYNGLQLSEAIEKHFSTSDFSTEVRINLIKNGWTFFLQSNGIGIGAGQFETYLQTGKGIYPTHHIVNSHNWFIQILAQYGLVIILPMLGWFIWIIKKQVQMLYLARQRDELYYFLAVAFLLLLIYVPLSSMPSNFLNNKFNWLVLFFSAYFTDKFSKAGKC